MSKRKIRLRKSQDEAPPSTEPAATAAPAESEESGFVTGGPVVGFRAEREAAPPVAPTEKAKDPTPSSVKSLEEELLAIARMDPSELARAMDGGTVRLKIGAKVRGRVTRLTKDFAFIDVGQKAEATLDLRDLAGAGVGATVEAFVMDVGDDYVRLSRTLRGSTAAAFLTEAEETGLPVEGEVIGRNPGGLVVRIGTVRGFCPASQAGGRGTDLDALVGRTLQFQVTDASGNEPVLSRRALVEADIQAREDAFFGEVEPGQRHTATVVSIQDFGAFVDIDGVQGLVHRSELGWDRHLAPSQQVTVGQSLDVVVLDVDRVARKLSLSAKDASASPWSRVGTDFVVGGVYEGTVAGVTEFGAFVQIAPGLQGLLHKSRTASVPGSGQTVKVRLDGVDVERKRLELSSPEHEGGESPRSAAPAAPRGQGGSFGTLGDLLGGLKLGDS
ncbi:MAG: S1 RNA-binding domain-containing protein [Deltaproteobacteria bacterium]|nr:MAG: S1 RNA-binding domain-containing protein [Deltaproteobacteria bacterium]